MEVEHVEERGEDQLPAPEFLDLMAPMSSFHLHSPLVWWCLAVLYASRGNNQRVLNKGSSLKQLTVSSRHQNTVQGKCADVAHPCIQGTVLPTNRKHTYFVKWSDKLILLQFGFKV